VIRQRIGALPTDAQDVLRIAAVAGETVRSELLFAGSRQPEESVLPVLDTLRMTGLLVEEGDDHYRFGHQLIHEVIEADLCVAHRAALHGRIQRIKHLGEAPAVSSGLAV
jgi:predicted ATPase